ncbi:response regulator [Desulfofundulus sp. TPOSR]|jgi:two-component system chemotaxis response regulator CheY|uniref:Stage 0 sporulation protein A homolog n=1 Tax=Desulfofundulus kuznetsovii (strain DSM 6115 / VKM B-1805 / 17) TaxID=760568 RepID=A0AAU8P9R5_DESK7|nr:response regulator [Desulfofundulus sp. TPOSR]AEG14611.1 response regulator receiver protein [Desulfofundulus kuznetsovii DSM 6115]NHM25894.1 response regulator [Desulfofundulus sp. TPOSR]
MTARVLVVDDSSTVRGYYTSILSKAGFTVDQAANGYEALEKSVEFDYDLFIVDINMPKMSGYELVRQLREDERGVRVPVVIISTEAKDSDRLEGYRAGANLFLVKPVRPERLLFLTKIISGVR